MSPTGPLHVAPPPVMIVQRHRLRSWGKHDRAGDEVLRRAHRELRRTGRALGDRHILGGLHEGRELVVRHFDPIHPEPVHTDPMNRPSVGHPIGTVVRQAARVEATHGELATGNPDHAGRRRPERAGPVRLGSGELAGRLAPRCLCIRLMRAHRRGVSVSNSRPGQTGAGEQETHPPDPGPQRTPGLIFIRAIERLAHVCGETIAKITKRVRRVRETRHPARASPVPSTTLRPGSAPIRRPRRRPLGPRREP